MPNNFYTDKYDIFLSYRRDGGETMAILLRERLSAKGYKVFLDIESLNSGSFNQKLLSVIENCTDVVVVCSKNSLDRCVNEGDWVRLEIAHAFKYGKNVVPIMLREFKFPDNLPVDIKEISIQNGVNANSSEYFDAAIERLMKTFLVSKPTKKSALPKLLKWLLAGAASLLIAVGLIVGGIALFGGGKEDRKDETVSPQAGIQADDEQPAPYMDVLPESGQQSNDNSEVAQRGNTNGNLSGISSGGNVAKQGDWIYIRNLKDKLGLYKMRADGSESIKLADGWVSFINIIGDWVYFRHWGEDVDMSIQKIRIDGSEHTVLPGKSMNGIMVINDWVYHADFSGIYRMRTDGSEHAMLHNKWSDSVNIIGDWLYFRESGVMGVSRIRTDGSGLEKVSNESNMHLVVEDEWLYFIDAENNLAKQRVGDNNPITLYITDGYFDGPLLRGNHITSINISGDWIYYRYGTTLNSSIYKMNLDGSDKTRLNYDDVGLAGFFVFDEWIYYFDMDEYFYRIRTDGTERQLLNQPVFDEELMFESNKISINYSPFVNNLSPELNSRVPMELIEEHLEILHPYAHTLRLFGVSGELSKIYKPAKEEYGFRIIAGCWLDRNYSEKQIYEELDMLIKLTNNGYVDIAVVGSELLFRRDISVNDLIKYIEYVKAGINDLSIHVTTSDSALAWVNSPELVEACDIILVTIYPFFNDVPVEYAADALKSAYEEVAKIANEKHIIISETGWVTAGSPEGAAVPSPENAARYFNDVYEWSLAENVEVIFFSAFDEAWKIEGRNRDIGMHWGHFYEDGTLKEVYRR
jgi:exo-beta-1,3-glucanase (GH17 family)